MLLNRLKPFAAIFLLIQTLLRLTLFVRGAFHVDFTGAEIGSIIIKGLWFDVIAMAFFLIPIALYHMALPSNKHGSPRDIKIDSSVRFLFTYILLFDFIAEHLFWSEFTTRFNFIAVDYLVYTHEVIGNITESYPIFWLLLGIAIIAYGITKLSIKIWPQNKFYAPAFKKRAQGFAIATVIAFALNFLSDVEQAQVSDNAVATEVAANGVYNLFNAFWHNEISYDKFYAKEDVGEVEQQTRELLHEDNQKFTSQDQQNLTRIVYGKGPELKKNVIMVVMESMSASYMETFGSDENLTPVLDGLADKSLFFMDAYATGTRTVRGLEALSLSIPPTPGQSIIRRPNNSNLFSLGFIFRDRGYDTKFIYGGYGYFDNMNNFFAGNGFDVVDRNMLSNDEIRFSNIWGVCDEDLFQRTIKEADASYASGKPFMYMVMTTSNHRPYTFPSKEAGLDIKNDRRGGVKYADYSVGQLLKNAADKPWFKDSIFIFVADHTAGAGGKAELDPIKYHIPIIFYSPGFVEPQKFKNIASQIDVGPTLLGMLNFTYYTKFYGEDLLNDADEVPHAFISNYQKVALIKQNVLTVLAPNRVISQYDWPDMTVKADKDKTHMEEAISYYQSASWWKDSQKRIPTVLAKK